MSTAAGSRSGSTGSGSSTASGGAGSGGAASGGAAVTAKLVAYWTVVGVPLAYGVVSTVQKAMALFTG